MQAPRRAGLRKTGIIPAGCREGFGGWQATTPASENQSPQLSDAQPEPTQPSREVGFGVALSNGDSEIDGGTFELDNGPVCGFDLGLGG